MKKVLTVTLALVALAAFSDSAVAQQKGTQNSPPTGVETKQPSAAPNNSAHATEKMTGKVTKLDEKAKTFTVMANGEEVTFSAAGLKAPLPKVGAIIDITYTRAPGGRLECNSITDSHNSTRSNVQRNY